MQSIFKTILGVLIIVLILNVGLGILWANNESVAAEQYLHTVADEISAANLQDGVIDACVEQAADNGYVLTYEVATDANGYKSYVVLTLQYKYTVNIASLSGWHTKTMTVS